MTFKKVDEAVATLIEMNDELTKIDAMLDECDRKNGDAPHRSVCRADRIKVLAGYSGVEPRQTPKSEPEVLAKKECEVCHAKVLKLYLALLQDGESFMNVCHDCKLASNRIQRVTPKSELEVLAEKMIEIIHANL